MLSSLFFVLSPHTKKHKQTTTHTMDNRCHHPRHLSMVPFWTDVIAVEDNHGVVWRLCRHMVSPRPLVLSSRRLVVACSVASVLHLLLYDLAPSSRTLVAPAGCCMSSHHASQYCVSRHLCHCAVLSSSCCSRCLCCPIILSLIWLVVTCRVVAICLAQPSRRLVALLVWFLLMPPVY